MAHKVGDTVWIRCQAHQGERYASQEEAEMRRCHGNEATFQGTDAWVSQTDPGLGPNVPRMPEGQGYVYTCLSCKRSFYVLMGAKF